ncbi:MAG: hypothetical protein R3F30_09085 [Planctomycetota bacterium]
MSPTASRSRPPHNGRFRAELLHGRAHMWPGPNNGEDGKTRVSDVVAGVFAGETLKPCSARRRPLR